MSKQGLGLITLCKGLLLYLKQLQGLMDGSVPPGRAWRVVATELLRTLVTHISQPLFDQQHGPLIQLWEVV